MVRQLQTRDGVVLNNIVNDNARRGLKLDVC